MLSSTTSNLSVCFLSVAIVILSNCTKCPGEEASSIALPSTSNSSTSNSSTSNSSTSNSSIGNPSDSKQDATKKETKNAVKRVENKSEIPLRIEREIVFTEGDGYQTAADLYRPASDDVCPIVIMIHGGAWISGDKWQVADHAKQMARKGFVVMAINYRLSPKHKWPAHLDDCFAALSWISKHATEWRADIERVGTWGYSAGAQLALLTALNSRADLPKVRAVVAGGAPCDLTFIPENTKALATVLGGTRAEVPERYRNASPISFVSQDAPPVYFFHGDDDFLVPLSNSIQMHESLLAKGIDTVHRTIAGKGHLIAFLDQQSRLEAIEFLEKFLKS